MNFASRRRAVARFKMRRQCRHARRRASNANSLCRSNSPSKRCVAFGRPVFPPRRASRLDSIVPCFALSTFQFHARVINSLCDRSPQIAAMQRDAEQARERHQQQLRELDRQHQAVQRETQAHFIGLIEVRFGGPTVGIRAAIKSRLGVGQFKSLFPSSLLSMHFVWFSPSHVCRRSNRRPASAMRPTRSWRAGWSTSRSNRCVWCLIFRFLACTSHLPHRQAHTRVAV